jgi:hypothetical protein
MIKQLIEPPIGLFEKVMDRISKERRILIIKRRIIVFSIVFVGSLFAFFPTLKMVSVELSSSGFNQFFSLIFSDFTVVMRYWQSFTLTLLETLPVISLVLFLTILLVFLESLKSLVKNIKMISKLNQLITD